MCKLINKMCVLWGIKVGTFAYGSCWNPLAVSIMLIPSLPPWLVILVSSVLAFKSLESDSDWQVPDALSSQLGHEDFFLLESSVDWIALGDEVKLSCAVKGTCGTSSSISAGLDRQVSSTSWLWFCREEEIPSPSLTLLGSWSTTCPFQFTQHWVEELDAVLKSVLLHWRQRRTHIHILFQMTMLSIKPLNTKVSTSISTP